MILKSKPAGDLFTYLRGAKGRFGKRRAHVELRGSTDLAVSLLDAQAPPWIFQDRRRRYSRHCRRHLTHIYTGFSEELEKVNAVLPVVIKTIESFVLAGLPRNVLAFVWYEHPQPVGAHVHGGLLHSVVPRGGVYEPNLDAQSMFRLARLLSYQLCLSDPLDPSRVRLIWPGPASASKPENQDLIGRVVKAVEACPEKQLRNHRHFLQLLSSKEVGLEVAAPAVSGRRPRPVNPAEPDGILSYPNTVGVWHPFGRKKEIVYFCGPVCNPRFSRHAWNQELHQRQVQFENINSHPELEYQEFQSLLNQRINEQRQRYPLSKEEPLVLEREFRWLGKSRDEKKRQALVDSLIRLSKKTNRESDPDRVHRRFGELPAISFPPEAHGSEDPLDVWRSELQYLPPAMYPFLDSELPVMDLPCWPQEGPENYSQELLLDDWEDAPDSSNSEGLALSRPGSLGSAPKPPDLTSPSESSCQDPPTPLQTPTLTPDSRNKSEEAHAPGAQPLNQEAPASRPETREQARTVEVETITPPHSFADSNTPPQKEAEKPKAPGHIPIPIVDCQLSGPPQDEEEKNRLLRKLRAKRSLAINAHAAPTPEWPRPLGPGERG